MAGGELSDDGGMLDLVGTIYDAALDVELWPDVLNRIGDAVGGPQIVFGLYDPPNGLVNMYAPRTDPDIMRRLADWTLINPELPCIADYPPGKVFSGADVIAPDKFSSTAFYHDWWRPAGFSTEPLVTNLFADGVASGHFASHVLPNGVPFDSSQKRLFAVIAQHLVRAVALQRSLHLTMAKEGALIGLDDLQQGFLVVDAQARILFVNRAARALLDARDGLRLEDGALSASDADAARILRGLIARSAAVAGENGARGDVTLPRGSGRVPLDLQVTPLRPETPSTRSLWVVPQCAAAIVLVSDPEAARKARVDMLRKRFGFTAAEVAFALEIIKGDGRQASADRLGISVGTARSHLSSIFDKTGSRRQAELVRLLLR
ncbi:helix-turn-helix transcriptional regulator [Tardiphaga sp.]|uniref:helix-turn-helix transcriptional regulator n=1 Tax=Tardiphaga sp. TaxID=1926292 RepID=UPI00352A172A